jgi:hypothetical protein
MQEGFILDSGHGGSRMVSRWVSGKPLKSFWMGLNIEDRENHFIQSFRCATCGYLESYAREL